MYKPDDDIPQRGLVAMRSEVGIDGYGAGAPGQALVEKRGDDDSHSCKSIQHYLLALARSSLEQVLNRSFTHVGQRTVEICFGSSEQQTRSGGFQ